MKDELATSKSYETIEQVHPIADLESSTFNSLNTLIPATPQFQRVTGIARAQGVGRRKQGVKGSSHPPRPPAGSQAGGEQLSGISVEVLDNGQHPVVIVWLRWQLQTVEDQRNIAFDRLLRDDQLARDPGVAVTLRCRPSRCRMSETGRF